LRPIGGSRRSRLALVALIAAAALALAGCGGSDGNTPPQAAADQPAAGTPTEPSPKVTLVDVSSLGELRKRFNADAGLPRLLLLLSPT
jgi:hypothetical protein